MNPQENPYYWMVPVKADALFLRSELGVPGPMADFRKQPWTDNQRDLNSGIPYTSEEMLSQPFADATLHLKQGIHLHWSLPDALTRMMVAQNGDTLYPNVPDRWLIQRTGTGLSPIQWIVESTYLYADGVREPGAITMPREKPEAGKQPWQFMGRSVFLKAYIADSPDQYADGITAVGWGDPAFAAFYPNCFSVFGFHDPEIRGNIPEGLTYTIIGYYSNPEKDYFSQFIQQYTQRNPGAAGSQLFHAVQEYFQWTTSDKYTYFPGGMGCYAVIQFSNGLNPDMTLPGSENGTGIAVGNTSTEALSAWLGYTLSPEFKNIREDQLEATQILSALNARETDVASAFAEARHTAGFQSLQSGVLWELTFDQVGTPSPTSPPTSFHVPEALASMLNELNILQNTYNSALWYIITLQRDLYADWYRYITASSPPETITNSYPDAGQIRWYMETRRMPDLLRLMEETGTVVVTRNAQGDITGVRFLWQNEAGGSLGSIQLIRNGEGVFLGASTEADPQSQAWKLTLSLNAMLNAIAKLNASHETIQAGIVWKLNGTGAPRWWAPSDPCIVVTGDVASATDRHSQDKYWREDGLLPCHITEIEGGFVTDQNGASVINPQLLANITEWTADGKEVTPGINIWTEQPWNPILLEWIASVEPLLAGSNFASPESNYSEDFITRNFKLPENAPDLVEQGNGAEAVRSNLLYMGRSLLTPGPGNFLLGKITAALNQQVMPDYYAMHPQVPSSPLYLENPAHLSAVITWYENLWFTSSTSAAEKASDPDYTLLISLRLLQQTNYLSQSLDGFTAGLVQRKTTLQLDVADPLAFPDGQNFAQAVAALVGPQNGYAPLPLNAFSPVRSGNLLIRKLRILDSFGRYATLNPENLIASEPLQPQISTSSRVSLPPRFAQPARLHLRWLSATDNRSEMNSHPDTTPLCGWMVPNLWDRGLMFYDASGQALGAIDTKCRWQPAPAGDGAIYYLPNIENEHLRHVILWLLEQGPAFFNDFVAAIEDGAENIAPDTYLQHGSLSLLMGQPLAIARVSLAIQMMGNRAVNQSWTALSADLHRPFRDSAMFEYIKVPVRLGEYLQLNDGLAGFWIEKGENYAGDLFYAPQTTTSSNPRIIAHGQSEFTLQVAPADAALYATVLFDPRGKLHATSGMLPVKTIDIPPDMYVHALNRMEVSFLVTPLLTDTEQLFIPAPSQPGYTWTWVERTRLDWKQTQNLLPPQDSAVFPPAQRLQEGWLKISPLPPDTSLT